MEKLLQDLLRFLVRYLQARRGVVLLYGGGEKAGLLSIEGEFQAGSPDVVIHSIPFESCNNVSKRIINKVKETGTDLVVSDVSNSAVALRDTYLTKNDIKSVICLPILKETELLGFLYIENGKVLEALTPSEVELLRYFSSQAAISIENARLYGELKTLNNYFIEKNVELNKEIKKRRLTEIKLASKNRELDTFFYKASHDLKGPIASIQGLTNLAQELFKEQETAEYIQHIEKSANKLDHILLNLINVTKINNADLVIEEVHVQGFVEEQIAYFKKHRPELKKIEIACTVDLKRRFFTDKSQLQVIIRNLIENSINYYDKREEKPFITIYVTDFGGGIKFSVADNGIGISKKVQNHIFDMFYRGTQRSTGAGLGLYIVKSAVTKLRGTVSYKSKAGEGSSFYVYLPNG